MTMLASTCASVAPVARASPVSSMHRTGTPTYPPVIGSTAKRPSSDHRRSADDWWNGLPYSWSPFRRLAPRGCFFLLCRTGAHLSEEPQPSRNANGSPARRDFSAAPSSPLQGTARRKVRWGT